MLDKAKLWQPAYDSDGQIRDGAFVAEATGLLNLTSWPAGMRVIIRKERPHPGAQLTDHRPRRQPDHRLRHQHHPRPARRPGTATPPTGPLRGPHPDRQGQRPAQPAAARLRPEPDLARDRRTGRRDHRLAATARLHRPPRPPLGTQTPAAAAVLHRRPHRRPRPNTTPAPLSPRPLGCAPDRGDRPAPAHPRARLNTAPPHPRSANDRPVEPAHRATSAKLSCPHGTITDHRGCRLQTAISRRRVKDPG